MIRAFILPTFRKCREHADHHELSIVVPSGNGDGTSIVYRIAENKKRYYLSKKVLNLRDEILRRQPSPIDGNRRPMWVGDIIDDDPVLLRSISEKIEGALRAIELPDAACNASFSRRPVWVGDIIDDDPVLLRSISEKIEGALRAIELPGAACSRDWVLHFIDQIQMRHYEFRASDGRLRTLKATILSQKSSRPVWVGDIIDDDPVLLQTISEKIEAAIELPDAACSRDWVLHFIDQMSH
ncbi:hypothetical protein PSTT_14278 [Puccinia striiformis]|uniref:Uncharacterized protein n=1 Tax=Puccinia striiformis TaxID=27350 RepID=A0A2S4UNM5_9BASI|nr:hypothetical protein PSTT_14278 [Puccinia striiformis]